MSVCPPPVGETQKGVITEHTICVGCTKLNETRQITVSNSKDCCKENELVTLTITRSIDDYACRLIQVKKGCTVQSTCLKTTFPDYMQNWFEEEWCRLWTPSITDDALAAGLACKKEVCDPEPVLAPSCLDPFPTLRPPPCPPPCNPCPPPCNPCSTPCNPCSPPCNPGSPPCAPCKPKCKPKC